MNLQYSSTTAAMEYCARAVIFASLLSFANTASATSDGVCASTVRDRELKIVNLSSELVAIHAVDRSPTHDALERLVQARFPGVGVTVMEDVDPEEDVLCRTLVVQTGLVGAELDSAVEAFYSAANADPVVSKLLEDTAVLFE